jgi:hypothetical protein
LFSSNAFLQLGCEDSERLLPPKDNAHVYGAEAHDQDWRGVRNKEYHDVVAETKEGRIII